MMMLAKCKPWRCSICCGSRDRAGGGGRVVRAGGTETRSATDCAAASLLAQRRRRRREKLRVKLWGLLRSFAGLPEPLLQCVQCERNRMIPFQQQGMSDSNILAWNALYNRSNYTSTPTKKNITCSLRPTHNEPVYLSV